MNIDVLINSIIMIFMMILANFGMILKIVELKVFFHPNLIALLIL